MAEISEVDWIQDARKKVALFNSYTDYLVICLDKLEKSNTKNAILTGALTDLRDGLKDAPEKIHYDRDTLLSWLNEYLQN
jgi:hypothetical protein